MAPKSKLPYKKPTALHLYIPPPLKGLTERLPELLNVATLEGGAALCMAATLGVADTVEGGLWSPSGLSWTAEPMLRRLVAFRYCCQRGDW